MLNSSVNLSAGEVIWKKGFGEWKSPSCSKDILQWLGSVIWEHQLLYGCHFTHIHVHLVGGKRVWVFLFFLFFFKESKMNFTMTLLFIPNNGFRLHSTHIKSKFRIHDSKTWNKAEQDNCLTSGLLKIWFSNYEDFGFHLLSFFCVFFFFLNISFLGWTRGNVPEEATVVCSSDEIRGRNTSWFYYCFFSVMGNYLDNLTLLHNLSI